MEEMQHYYKERIIEALNSMKSEKYLKMVFFFTRSCYKEEKKGRVKKRKFFHASFAYEYNSSYSS